jgi:hypothetical protein
MNAPEKISAWEQLARPPKDALKAIKGGRLSGMTDVNPQWRYKVMHDTFGPCGIGWKYEVTRLWTEPGLDGQMFAFASVLVYTKQDEGWSAPIPGIGGSMLLEKDKNGIHHNDESFKMATTDALSVALKMLGVAADIYMGRWDGTKYKDTGIQQGNGAITPSQSCADDLTDEERVIVFDSVKEAVTIYRETGDIQQVDQHLRFTTGLTNDMLAAVPYFLGAAKTEDGKKLSTAWTKFTKSNVKE